MTHSPVGVIVSSSDASEESQREEFCVCECVCVYVLSLKQEMKNVFSIEDTKS